MRVLCIGGACHGQIVREPDREVCTVQTAVDQTPQTLGMMVGTHMVHQTHVYTRRVMTTFGGKIVFFAPAGMSDHSALMFALS